MISSAAASTDPSACTVQLRMTKPACQPVAVVMVCPCPSMMQGLSVVPLAMKVSPGPSTRSWSSVSRSPGPSVTGAAVARRDGAARARIRDPAVAAVGENLVNTER